MPDIATPLAALGVDRRLFMRAAVAPAAFLAAWNVPGWVPNNVSISDDRIAPYGSVNTTGAAIFDLYSTARSAPVNTYYVSVNGSDSANGLTLGTAFASWGKAVQTANATGQPAKIIISAGTYTRLVSATNGDDATYTPSVDIAFIASGGRVISGVFDAYAAPALDITNSNTYTFTVANVNKVVDLLSTDRFGLYNELTFVTTAALCNLRPGSWSYEAGKIYINRGDGAAVTNANTRVYRAGTPNFSVRNSVNIYLGGADNISGFDFEGGATGAARYVLAGSVPATQKAWIAEKCTFRYAGGLVLNGSAGQQTTGAANGVSMESMHGLCLFFDCDASGNHSDGFNAHKLAVPGVSSCWGTVNCSGFNNGRFPSLSNQGWTQHETCIGFDIAGVYENGHGGTIRPINASYSWLVGTQSRYDLGDQIFGGVVPPSALVVDNTAQVWMDNVGLIMPAGQTLVNVSSTASVFTRNMPTLRSPYRGNGTFGTY